METIKSLFNSIFTTDLTKEETKARENLNKITADCADKTKVAQQAVNEASAAKVAKEAAEKALAATKLTTTGGKSRRKGTRKPKGRKNKKTHRN
jgi:hypothetical protein